MSKKNVFIVGYDEFNVSLLKQAPISEQLEYHPALTYDDLKSSEEVPALELLERAQKIIQNSSFEPDAIVTFWDFPATILAAMLANRFGLCAPPTRSIFKCENKLWSRNEQRKVIIEHIPLYTGFNPHDEEAFSKVNLVPPFWIKPIKSFRSFLAFRVNSAIDFEHHRQQIAASIDGIYKPFQDLMRKARIPDLIANSEESCIAESTLSGHMCTVEGYVHDEQVISYGIVDSIREENTNSFNRYQYPSILPMEIQYRMMDLTRRVVEQIDLKDCCFNIEFFYNQTDESIYLLEINPRTSQSHSDLFHKVHGVTQFQILLEIALGRRPRPLRNEGAFKIAAKYMYRTHESGIVQSVPDAERLAEIETAFPGTRIKLHVSVGDNLNDLLFQDAYSFELADIYIGAQNEMQLDETYQAIVQMMDIRLAPHSPTLTYVPGRSRLPVNSDT